MRSPGENKINLAVFEQDEVWITADQRRIPLEDMTLDHLRNTMAFVERNAEGYVMKGLLAGMFDAPMLAYGGHMPVVVGEIDGRPIERMACIPPHDDIAHAYEQAQFDAVRDPVGWVRKTKLYKRMAQLVEQRVAAQMEDGFDD